MNDIGVVIIGRNEGERLKVCIRSFSTNDLNIVYVDSGSTDGSVQLVKELGFDVIDLDMSQPFSAARARNEGYQFLLGQYEEINFIQFVDGDCEISRGWLNIAYEHLQHHQGLASVCGRRKERYADRTIYNQLCDIEWDTPVGIAMATGGDFMCRKQALVDVQGFDPQVIAGEEPELCFRMRKLGWKIERLGVDMTVHDAHITKFSQWWRRCERSGHAYAQGFCMHGGSDEKYYRGDVARILLWALIVPLLIVFGVVFFGYWVLLLCVLYFVKIAQIFTREVRCRRAGVALAYASSLIFGKFPQCKGAFSFLMRSIFRKTFQIIEYKV
jgi:glycosyltransferase involved in cell wall biosynthesis